jgi:hypothetical protein
VAEKDLGEINTLINDYYRAHKTLPSSLTDVGAKAPLTDRLQKYTYKPGTSPHYQLCATFETKDGANTVPPLDDSSYLSTYGHDKGTVCYKLVPEASYGILDSGTVNARSD